ncbi:MAG: glycosyltransferase [Caldisericia bacterium]|nr:glycosyltransferase [Caldisericia bacterium]
MKKKAVLITHIPAPYQVAFAKALHEYLDIQFWFMTSIPESNRPSYWEMELPDYCKILKTSLKKGQFFYSPKIKEYMENFHPDYLVLHGRWNNLSWHPAYKWAVHNNAKIVMGPFEMPVAQNIAKEIIRKSLYKEIDAILCAGYKTLDYYRFKCKKVLHYGYAADINRELSHSIRKPKDIVTFLHSGSINKRFRVEEILNASEKIYLMYPNLRIVLSGNGPDRKAIENRIQNSTVLSKIVSWLDVNSWEEVQDVYLSSDVLISYPSYAGWGLTIPEAMASGMGIISGINVTSARELIIPGFNGFLVDSNDELENSMMKYLSNPKIVHTHGALNKDIAEKEGTKEKAKRLVSILESL